MNLRRVWYWKDMKKIENCFPLVFHIRSLRCRNWRENWGGIWKLRIRFEIKIFPQQPNSQIPLLMACNLWTIYKVELLNRIKAYLILGIVVSFFPPKNYYHYYDYYYWLWIIIEFWNMVLLLCQWLSISPIPWLFSHNNNKSPWSFSSTLQLPGNNYYN